ncbi:hypothetical protein GCM10011365_08470 [Marinicella pacifica]|uniref:Uncharacterized protein n=1 Tax=Marinicella pacifica TaxID=1171543 RepID=A0A917FLD9_9GAMM|nr:hypothetical protein [Marinicella pacifica]GGF89604.1 hypothetical protein GCM10011365_08470 [Marinicella pacifica]
MKIHQKNKKTLQKRINRAVASSSAIEIDLPVHAIEKKIQSKHEKFSQLKLAD